MENMITSTGESVKDLSEKGKVMLVFLRHFGCTFCRESMAELSKLKQQIADAGTQLVVIHQLNEESGKAYLDLYGLNDTIHMADPGKHLYDYFELKRAKFNQVFGFKDLWRAVVAGLFKGHLIGPERGDGWQMPGIFVIHKEKIIARFVHKHASDQPDYLALAQTPISYKRFKRTDVKTAPARA